ncbi:Gm5148 [Phodopus roborovskii]|uniref:Gm5148 protein n=1 Tax=Phodopus roborovskii TaxID=109678 RepID=A0AAU9Z0Y4_PHORO|nr:Gm5148 [Phodopus roborovskii]
MAFSTKPSNQNFIVFLNEVQAAIIGHESCDLLAVLDELHPDTLPDSRIWLFGFNPYFFQHNPFCMRGTSERVGLQGCAQVGFLVLFVMPLLVPSVAAELPGSTETTALAHLAGATAPRERVINCFLTRTTIV